MNFSTTFSSDGLEAVSRQVQSTAKKIKTEEGLRSYYEIERCQKFISSTSNDFHRVGKVSTLIVGILCLGRP